MMVSFTPFLLATLATLSAAAPAVTTAQTQTKIFLISDSTAMNYNPSTSLIQGFGYFLPSLLNPVRANLTNLSRGGRSTRSFINEGLWASAVAQFTKNSVVIIEHGHNDAGTPGVGSDIGKDRATLPGIGDETTVVVNAVGQNETVRTFGSYLRQMIGDVKSTGATPVLSGMVPVMVWTSNNTVLRTNWPFRDYAREVAESQKGVGFLDHTTYSVRAQQDLGYDAAMAMYPLLDATHTDAKGAELNAEALVRSVRCAKKNGGLKKLLAKGVGKGEC